VEESEKEENEEILLEEHEVYDMLQFAGAALGIPGTAGAISIDLINAKMKDISLLTTGDVTETQVSDALKLPKESERELQRISESFEITSPLYKRLLSYLGNIPAFDFTYVCENADEKDYKSSDKRSQYRKDFNIFKEFMQSFDYKQEFGKVVKELFRNEAYFSIFRTGGKKFVLQELPSDYAKISGKFDYGLLFSFDYTWFGTGVDIDMYPDIFKKTLRGLNKNAGVSYNPATSILSRSSHSFAQWVDCSPIDGFWSFKLSPEVVTRIPYFSGMFPDIVQEATIRELQKSSYMAAASKVIAGTVPMLSGKTKIKDAISISPDILGKFLALIQSAINNTAIKVTASPLENMKGFDFKSDPDIRSSYLRTVLGSAGSATNLLFASDVKPNTVESMLSLAVDEILATSIYPQFDDFINWHVNRLTTKFKFKVKFEGSKFYPDKERRMEVAKDFAELGIVLPQKFAAAAGMSPFELDSQMEEARAQGWVDKLTPILKASQMPKEGSDGVGAGAPKKKDSDLTESGEQTRGDGGNEEIK